VKKNLVYYIVIVGFFMGLAWVIINQGKSLTPNSREEIHLSNSSEKSTPIQINSTESLKVQFLHNIQHPLSLLLLQIIIILVISRLFGLVITRFGQPSVIGEIIAGLFLGPSVMGAIFPNFFEFVFPVNSLETLQFLSQVGLMFFMFIIGMELDLESLKKKAQDALVISHASIIFPFFLGILLSYFIYELFASPETSFLSFSLFMGTAMSITAFPVLARILKERGMTKSPIGNMALTCAAIDDVTAWCVLAAVIAIVKAGSIVSALFTIVLAVAFVGLMFFVIRPWIKKLSFRTLMVSETLDKSVIAIVFFILLLSAYFAEIIGIHALFGAFLAGVIMPQNLMLKESLTDKLEDISVLILLPIFFAFTGLRTHIGLLNEGHLWATCGIVMLVAVIGKVAGSSLSAKLVGQSWKDSFTIGALMNTRGLMELIVLNIGYDLGVLSPEIFAIMVLMALSTTFMTGPFLELIEYLNNKHTARKLR
jgi:Kef-type K+ transport system membrane component KefB